jgi:hypothetical protein
MNLRSVYCISAADFTFHSGLGNNAPGLTVESGDGAPAETSFSARQIAMAPCRREY